MGQREIGCRWSAYWGNGRGERLGWLVAGPFNGRDAATRAGVCCQFGTVERDVICRVDNLFPLVQMARQGPHWHGWQSPTRISGRICTKAAQLAREKKGLIIEYTQAYMTMPLREGREQNRACSCIVGPWKERQRRGYARQI